MAKDGYFDTPWSDTNTFEGPRLIVYIILVYTTLVYTTLAYTSGVCTKCVGVLLFCIEVATPNDKGLACKSGCGGFLADGYG